MKHEPLLRVPAAAELLAQYNGKPLPESTVRAYKRKIREACARYRSTASTDAPEGLNCTWSAGSKLPRYSMTPTNLYRWHESYLMSQRGYCDARR